MRQTGDADPTPGLPMALVHVEGKEKEEKAAMIPEKVPDSESVSIPQVLQGCSALPMAVLWDLRSKAPHTGLLVLGHLCCSSRELRAKGSDAAVAAGLGPSPELPSIAPCKAGLAALFQSSAREARPPGRGHWVWARGVQLPGLLSIPLTRPP